MAGNHKVRDNASRYAARNYIREVTVVKKLLNLYLDKPKGTVEIVMSEKTPTSRCDWIANIGTLRLEDAGGSLVLMLQKGLTLMKPLEDHEGGNF